MLAIPHTQIDRNLRRVGMCVSWATGKPRLLTHKDRARSWIGSCLRYLLVVGFQLPFVLLSWVQVAWWGAIYLRALLNDRGRPSELREFEWRLRNVDMSFEQLAREFHMMQRPLGQQKTPYSEFRDDLWKQAIGKLEP